MSAATMEAWPDDDLQATVEDIVVAARLDTEEAIRVLQAQRVLPSSREVSRSTMTPCYKEAIRCAAEVSLVAEIVRKIKETNNNDAI